MLFPAKLLAIVEGNSRVLYENRHRRNVWPPRKLCRSPHPGWKEKKIHPQGHRKELTTVEQYSAREEGRRKQNSDHYEGRESQGSMHSSQWWLWMSMCSGSQKTQMSREGQKAETFLLPPVNSPHHERQKLHLGRRLQKNVNTFSSKKK